MSKTATPYVALCAGFDLPTEGEVPEWVHLLPAAHGEIRTFDGRGPYHVTDPAAIIAASMSGDPRDENGLIIDENHSVDIAGPVGLPSPSRGKIMAMEVRDGGIWGKMKWNAAGKALLADQAYRGISPVIMHDADGVVTRILRASLVNYPNLRGLAALNQESPMNWAKIAKALGLAETATEDDIVAAIASMKQPDTKAEQQALQASLTAIGTALGVSGGDAAAILAAAQTKMASKPEDVVALQSQLTEVTTSFNSLNAQIKREKAEGFVDRAIADARPGVKPMRDYYISRHMENPGETEKAINAIPSFSAGRLTENPAPREVSIDNNLTALNAEQQGRALHDRAVAFQSEQKAKGLTVALFDAIAHVKKEVLL
ncbi:MAG: hypothetical protein CFE33_15080 [Pseudorhodobacter sp. PARRP1]|nr:MAG: hypothetical protein CFE33_15080 [Pseudorhodobacter sp. PARRP1]